MNQLRSICFRALGVFALVTWAASADAAGLTLQWNANTEPDIAGYVLYWGISAGVHRFSVDVRNQTSWTVPALANATTYYFVVRAYNTSGMLSADSGEASGPTSTSGSGCIGAGCGLTDFNGDLKPDLVWQNDTTRQVSAWFMGGAQGNALLGWTYLSQAGVLGWHLVTMRDFNGDGKPDIVWQNDSTRQVTVWYMGGTQGNVLQGWSYLSQNGVPGWSVVGAGDFNGDGKPDLVWMNDSTRQVTVWYMSGTQGNVLSGWSYLSQDGVPGWRVAAIGDFNSDSKPDLVWLNDTSRQASVWYMGGTDGNVFEGWNFLSSGGVPGWTPVGTGDFNGDGIPDLVWMNDTTRQVSVWYMSGTQGNLLLGWNYLSAAGVPGWTAIAR